jgi:hypothetical protein
VYGFLKLAAVSVHVGLPLFLSSFRLKIYSMEVGCRPLNGEERSRGGRTLSRPSYDSLWPVERRAGSGPTAEMSLHLARPACSIIYLYYQFQNYWAAQPYTLQSFSSAGSLSSFKLGTFI